MRQSLERREVLKSLLGSVDVLYGRFLRYFAHYIVAHDGKLFEVLTKEHHCGSLDVIVVSQVQYIL